jgi:hypothetical protein
MKRKNFDFYHCNAATIEPDLGIKKNKKKDNQ